ncbi:MAG: hypothetical protein F6K45_02040 [Kamptonema sp. SIO1D9]|nr:hypothetical protein [Kamptonema sp. SIO1D9]
MSYSKSITSAWERAAIEAQETNHQEIEPIHILISLCWLVDSNPESEALATEIETIKAKLEQANLNPTPLRRSLRGVAAQPASPTSPDIIHRSPASRRVFQRGENIAHGDGREFQLVDLLQALLEIPYAPWSKIFLEMGVSEPLKQMFGVTAMEALAITQVEELLEGVSEGNSTSTEQEEMITQALDSNPLIGKPQVVAEAIKRNPKLRRMLKIGGMEFAKLVFPPLSIAIEMYKIWEEED